jgi:hypothetical protein
MSQKYVDSILLRKQDKIIVEPGIFTGKEVGVGYGKP